MKVRPATIIKNRLKSTKTDDHIRSEKTHSLLRIILGFYEVDVTRNHHPSIIPPKDSANQKHVSEIRSGEIDAVQK